MHKAQNIVNSIREQENGLYHLMPSEEAANEAQRLAYARGRRDENEACAKVAETKGRTKRHVATAIRARIKKGEGDE